MAEKDDLRERLEAAASSLCDSPEEYDRKIGDTLREVLAHPERLMGEPVARVLDRHPICAHDGCELLTKRYPQITEAHTGTPREGHFRQDYASPKVKP